MVYYQGTGIDVRDERCAWLRTVALPQFLAEVRVSGSEQQFPLEVHEIIGLRAGRAGVDVLDQKGLEVGRALLRGGLRECQVRQNQQQGSQHDAASEHRADTPQPAPGGGRFVRGVRCSTAAARVVVHVGGDVPHLEPPCVAVVRRGGLSYGPVMGRLPAC